MSAVTFVWPWPVDDPARPSGGNRYDARLRDGLRAAGWRVAEHVVAGPWPQADARLRDALAQALQEIAAGALVVIDGVMAAAAADAIVAARARLRTVILSHMPFGEARAELADAERRALAASAGVLTTSAWTRAWILDHYGLPPRRIASAPPGVDSVPPVAGSAGGARLLVVANVSALKGYDVLVDALGALGRLDFCCTCVGRPPDDEAFAVALRTAAERTGIARRLRWTGALAGAALEAEWRAADVLLLPSRRESYGMVVAEALAHGLPVIGSRVGGIPEALSEIDGALPGLLVAPAEPLELAQALRSWLGDAALRKRLRAVASARRRQLRGWTATTQRVADFLLPLAGGAHAGT